MRKFIQRALKMLPKLDRQQVSTLIGDLASENERLELVLDSMTDGVLVADVENRLVYSNKSAERYLPLKNRGGAEKMVWDSVRDQDISDFLKEVLIEKERIEDREFTLDGSGSVRLLSFSVSPLVREGRIQGSIVHIEDITEKRGRESRLRRAENLAALTTLAAGVAHEIKNPLGSIGIHIQLIQKALKKEELDREHVRKYLAIIDDEIERLNGIVVDFLFAVRPMDTNLESRDINSLIDDLLDFLKFEVEDAGVELKVHYDHSLPNLLIDEKFFKQALLNVIKNAIAAMPEGGTLRVSTEGGSDQAHITVVDTGVGISEENMAKIFEPYFTTKEFGSGLGLTVVYKIVKEHGGEITLNSKEGEGTAFTIHLPLPESEKRLIGYKDKKHEV